MLSTIFSSCQSSIAFTQGLFVFLFLFLAALSSMMTEKQKYKVRVSRVDGHYQN